MVVDFTTFSKVDPNGAISFTSNRLIFTDFHREENAWAYFDYGIGFFTDYEHWLELHVDSINPYGGIVARALITLASGGPDNWVENDGRDQIGLYIRSTGTSNQFDLTLRRSHAGSSANGTTIILNTGIIYYLKWLKSGVDHSLEIYSDPGRSILIGIITLTDVGDYNYRYLIGVQSYTAGSNAYEITGYIQNYLLTPIFSTSEDLKAEFFVQYKFEDLKTEFTLRQLTADLKTEFYVGQWRENLFVKFYIIPNLSKDLFAELIINQENASNNLFCKFGVRRIYDLSDQGGIGFFWKGVGRGHVDIQISSFTGAWIGKFPDYGEWTWVSLLWEDLREVDIDGSLPDKSQVTGFLWTYHSPGIRRLDGFYGLPIGGDPDVKALMIIRQAAYNELPAYLFRNLFREDLEAEFMLLQNQPGRGSYITGPKSVADMAPFYWGSQRDPYGIDYAISKKSFYAKGRHWLIYCQGELDNVADRELCYISSKDRVNFSTKTLIPDAITKVSPSIFLSMEISKN